MIRCTVVVAIVGTMPRAMASWRTCSRVRVIGMYFGFARRSVPVLFCPTGPQASAMISQRVTALNSGAWTAPKVSQPLETLPQEAASPALNLSDGNPQACRNGSRAATFSTRQDDARAPHPVGCWWALAPGHSVRWLPRVRARAPPAVVHVARRLPPRRPTVPESRRNVQRSFRRYERIGPLGGGLRDDLRAEERRAEQGEAFVLRGPLDGVGAERDPSVPAVQRRRGPRAHPGDEQVPSGRREPAPCDGAVDFGLAFRTAPPGPVSPFASRPSAHTRHTLSRRDRDPASR